LNTGSRIILLPYAKTFGKRFTKHLLLIKKIKCNTRVKLFKIVKLKIQLDFCH